MTVRRADTIKMIIFTLTIAFCTVLSVSAQNARLEIDQLDRLFPKAVETVDVRVEGSLLMMASKFLRSDNADEAMQRNCSPLKGVYVKGVEFDKDGEYSDADVESVRTQLRAPGWDRIVGVRSKRDGENVEVFLMLETPSFEGISVLVFDPNSLWSSTSSARSTRKRSTSCAANSAFPKISPSIGAE